MSEVAPSRFARIIGLMLFAALPATLIVLSSFNIVAAMDARQVAADDAVLLERIRTRLRSGNLSANAPADLSAVYLSGASPSLAGAALRQGIADAIAAAGGKLIETRAQDNVSPPSGAIVNAVAINVTFDIGNEGLARFMYQIESGLPLLEVESLAVRKTATSGAETEPDPSLRVDMLVKGNWRPAAP